MEREYISETYGLHWITGNLWTCLRNAGEIRTFCDYHGYIQVDDKESLRYLAALQWAEEEAHDCRTPSDEDLKQITGVKGNDEASKFSRSMYFLHVYRQMRDLCASFLAEMIFSQALVIPAAEDFISEMMHRYACKTCSTGVQVLSRREKENNYCERGAIKVKIATCWACYYDEKKCKKLREIQEKERHDEIVLAGKLAKRKAKTKAGRSDVKFFRAVAMAGQSTKGAK